EAHARLPLHPATVDPPRLALGGGDDPRAEGGRLPDQVNALEKRQPGGLEDLLAIGVREPQIARHGQDEALETLDQRLPGTGGSGLHVPQELRRQGIIAGGAVRHADTITRRRRRDPRRAAYQAPRSPALLS